MKIPDNGCSAMALSELASRHMTPEIQQVAIAHLGDSDPQVAAGAAATLGRYGSDEAEQPLWDRFERWHAQWADRASELPDGSGSALQNGIETALEQALIDALGAGQAWFAGPRALARLSKLCVSAGGCQRVQEIITEAEAAPNINVYRLAPDYRASVAQYQAGSLDALKQKLVQFPQGTVFTWSFGGDEKEGAAALADLRAFLKGRGMTIR